MYRRFGYVLGEANCLWGLGVLARKCGDTEAARHFYEKAGPLFRQVSDAPGEGSARTLILLPPLGATTRLLSFIAESKARSARLTRCWGWASWRTTAVTRAPRESTT